MLLQCCRSFFTFEIAIGLKFRQKRQFWMEKSPHWRYLKIANIRQIWLLCELDMKFQNYAFFDPSQKIPTWIWKKFRKHFMKPMTLELSFEKIFWFADSLQTYNKSSFDEVSCSFIILFICPKFICKIPQKMSAVAWLGQARLKVLAGSADLETRI